MQPETYDTYDLVNFRMKNGRKVFTQGTVTKPERDNGAGEDKIMDTITDKLRPALTTTNLR